MSPGFSVDRDVVCGVGICCPRRRRAARGRRLRRERRRWRRRRRSPQDRAYYGSTSGTDTGTPPRTSRNTAAVPRSRQRSRTHRGARGTHHPDPSGQARARTGGEAYSVPRGEAYPCVRGEAGANPSAQALPRQGPHRQNHPPLRQGRRRWRQVVITGQLGLLSNIILQLLSSCNFFKHAQPIVINPFH